MRRLSVNYKENITLLEEGLGYRESFDIIERRLNINDRGMCFFYIDGFVKDLQIQKVMEFFLKQTDNIDLDSVIRKLPYIEVETSHDLDDVILKVLSGQTAIISECFSDGAILIDARTYPMRSTEEPSTDRVMQGAHDGFVETLVTNTALIRRRIRDGALRFEHFSMGGSSGTDICITYMKGVADEKILNKIRDKLKRVKPKSLTLGFRSLSETLIREGWYNPFPKVRTTERPDSAAAELLEGKVLILCDTAPQAIIMPCSIFDFLQQTDDYYFPPLTGSYMRIIRTFSLLLSVIWTPLWLLYLEYAYLLPEELMFLIPSDVGALPLVIQLLLVEIGIDALKIASMNTPDMLSNSLSIVGALILGDFAVAVGWLCQDVILYMAFVAIANFSQQNHELGFAFKFVRILLLILVAIANVWGFAFGMGIFIILLATNRTILGKSYLYPLIPFNFTALKRLFIREKKHDFYTE